MIPSKLTFTRAKSNPTNQATPLDFNQSDARLARRAFPNAPDCQMAIGIAWCAGVGPLLAGPSGLIPSGPCIVAFAATGVTGNKNPSTYHSQFTINYTVTPPGGSPSSFTRTVTWDKNTGEASIVQTEFTGSTSTTVYRPEYSMNFYNYLDWSQIPLPSGAPALGGTFAQSPAGGTSGTMTFAGDSSHSAATITLTCGGSTWTYSDFAAVAAANISGVLLDQDETNIANSYASYMDSTRLPYGSVFPGDADDTQYIQGTIFLRWMKNIVTQGAYGRTGYSGALNSNSPGTGFTSWVTRYIGGVLQSVTPVGSVTDNQVQGLTVNGGTGFSMCADAAGNFYWMNFTNEYPYANAQTFIVYKYTKSTGQTSILINISHYVTASSTFATGISAMTCDAAGNLYFANSFAGSLAGDFPVSTGLGHPGIYKYNATTQTISLFVDLLGTSTYPNIFCLCCDQATGDLYWNDWQTVLIGSAAITKCTSAGVTSTYIASGGSTVKGPWALAAYGGVLYIADTASNSVYSYNGASFTILDTGLKARGIGVDSSGNVYYAGEYAFGGTGPSDYIVRKCHGSSPVTIADNFGSPGPGTGIVGADFVAVSSNGDVFWRDNIHSPYTVGVDAQLYNCLYATNTSAGMAYRPGFSTFQPPTGFYSADPMLNEAYNPWTGAALGTIGGSALAATPGYPKFITNAYGAPWSDSQVNDIFQFVNNFVTGWNWTGGTDVITSVCAIKSVVRNTNSMMQYAAQLTYDPTTSNTVIATVTPSPALSTLPTQTSFAPTDQLGGNYGAFGCSYMGNATAVGLVMGGSSPYTISVGVGSTTQIQAAFLNLYGDALFPAQATWTLTGSGATISTSTDGTNAIITGVTSGSTLTLTVSASGFTSHPWAISVS